MAIDLPEIGQVDWGGDLNAALTQLDEQTVIGAERQGDDIVFLKNNGAEMNLGSFKGDPGEPGEDGAPGPQGPQGPPGSLFQTFLVESYAEPGDTSDSEAWQRAVNDAVALPEGTPSQIIGTRPEYRFHTPVNVRGLKNCRIGGGAGARPVLKAADGAGALIIFRTSAGMGSPSGGGTNIFALGDSMTEDDAWLSQVESYSGITVVDGGLAGQSTTDGALRSGGLPTTVTLESNTLPTSGTATISSINPNSYWRLVSLQRQVRVSLKAPTGDIPGVLFWPTTTQSNWRFEADTAPSTAVSVPAGTSIEVLEDLPNKSAVGYQDHNLIYWMGRNNMSNTSVIERDDAAVMGAFTGKKMILGVLNATNEPRGSSNYNAIVEINRRRAELYGSQFWDVRSYIIHELIYAMNTVPTAADLANMANDCPPPSIMADTVHFSPAASAVLGREMYRQLMYRGMVPYKTGDITENVVFENLRFEGGAADVPDGMFDRNQARTTGPDHITHAIKLDGHRTPGESAMGIVRNITVRDVELRGVRSLPLFIRGASNVVVTQNFIRRCLDTGFIWCQGVKFTLNRVEWSADNGVSLSQGCREVVCADNTIIGSYYAGVHCGGWNGWPGVHHLTVSGNTIVQSRQFGISLIDGATFASVSGNVIDGVLRGGASENRDYMADVAGQFNGTGILVTGYISSGRGSSTPTVTAISKDVVISGNSVRNCDRNGINFGAGVSGLSITGNTLRNIGSLTSVSGNPISSTHKAYNIAIGSYGTYSTGMEDVVVTGNQVIDDRPEPATNYAVSLTNVTRGNERSNAGFGMRNAQTF